MTDLNEKALVASRKKYAETARRSCVEAGLADGIRAYIEAATPSDMAGLIAELEAFAVGCRGSMWQSREETIRLCEQAATALRLSAGGGETGQWKEIETNFQIKGLRTSPAYFPATGEVCEVSGPNCDDANGYTWMSVTVLWQNEKFVLYGLDGFWPNLHKREHVLFRPLPASPTVEAGHVE